MDVPYSDVHACKHCYICMHTGVVTVTKAGIVHEACSVHEADALSPAVVCVHGKELIRR